MYNNNGVSNDSNRERKAQEIMGECPYKTAGLRTEKMGVGTKREVVVTIPRPMSAYLQRGNEPTSTKVGSSRAGISS